MPEHLCTGEVVAYRWSHQDFPPLGSPCLNPISQLLLLPFCVLRRGEVAQTHSQNSTARVIPSHTIQSLCLGDYQPLWCHHWGLYVSIRNVLFSGAPLAAESGMQCQFSQPPQEQQWRGSQRNIMKIRRAFSMKKDPHFTESLLPGWLEEQLNSTDNKMRVWCLWKSFRTSPSLKRMQVKRRRHSTISKVNFSSQMLPTIHAVFFPLLF